MYPSQLVKNGQLGQGVYGKVYDATSYPEAKKVAVKRNFAYKHVMGISNLRELDILHRLKDHPFILQILDVKFGSVFSAPMSPVQSDRRNVLKDDGFEIDKKSIILENPLRELGAFDVKIKVHPEVSAKIKVWLVKKGKE